MSHKRKPFEALNDLLKHRYTSLSNIARDMAESKSLEESAIRKVDGRKNRGAGHNYQEMKKIQPELTEIRDSINLILKEIELIESGDAKSYEAFLTKEVQAVA